MIDLIALDQFDCVGFQFADIDLICRWRFGGSYQFNLINPLA